MSLVPRSKTHEARFGRKARSRSSWSRSAIGLLLAWAAIAGVLALAVASPAGALPGKSSAPAWRSEDPEPTVTPQPVQRPSRGPNPEAAQVPASEPVNLPEPEVAVVDVDATATEAGSTPVSVSDPAAANNVADAPDSVTVEVLPPADTASLDASAFAFTVERADDGTTAAPIGLKINYDGFRNAFGGDFGSRVVLKSYPACILDTPEDEACSKGKVVRATNDVASGTLTVDTTADPVPADPTVTDPNTDPSASTTTTSTTTPADSTTTTDPSSTTTTTEPPTTTPGGGALPAGSIQPASLRVKTAAASVAPSGGTVFALSSGVSGTTGNYAATSLSQAQRWQAGGSSGNASWSYPIDVPAAPVGPTPALGLSYSSQAVDAMTPGSNSQPGQVGLGWGMSGLGFIERRYRSCSQDSTGWVTNDLCWRTDNATISMNGVSSELIETTQTNYWRVEDDPGWTVEHRTTGSNGDNNNEFWIVTTTDGTQYWYGAGVERGGSTPTNSTWTVPVFGNSAGEPCNASTTDASWCQQAWRWNLDRVVDPNDNYMNVYWQNETNQYGRQGYPARNTTYDRGGYPTKISYGSAGGSSLTPATVVFDYADRCTASMTGGSCPTPSAANASQFPDVPADLVCSGNPCDDYSPSFFSTKRLTGIDTAVRSGTGAWKMVDRYALNQLMPSNTDGSDAKLWLDKVQRIGNPTYALLGYTGTNVTMPPVEFDGVLKANRADSGGSVGPALLRRLAVVSEELGALTYFTYGQPGHTCVDKNGPWDNNSQYCFPIYFKPDGGTAGWAVNNTYVVTQVQSVDGVAGSPTQTTSYSYDTAPAWHHDVDDVAPTAGQTWSDYRGHSHVTVTNGASRTTYLYYRGMDGNKQIGGPPQSVSIVDQLGGSDADSDYLAGRLREERQLEDVSTGNSALSATIHDYQAPGGPASGQHQVHVVREISARSRTVEGAGTIDTRVNSDYEGHGIVTVVHSLGTTDGGDERCTQYEYTQNVPTGMLDRVRRERSSANCGAPYTSVTDTFYDNAASFTDVPGRGNPTRVRKYLDASLVSTNAITTSATYDGFGRPTSATSARSKVTTTTYGPATNDHTNSVTVVNPKGYTTTTNLDARRGQPISVVDQNGRTTSSTYDALGRLATVATPQDTGSGLFSYKFGYEVTKSWESKVHSYQRLGTGYVDSWTLVDGFGRTRETQADAPSGVDRVVSQTTYDSRGLVATQSQPFHASGVTASGQSSLVNAAPSAVPNDTATAYDSVSRPGYISARANGVSVSLATKTYSGFTTTSVSPRGASRRDTTNAYGDLVQVKELFSAGGAQYTLTKYDYTAAGLLSSIEDTKQNHTTYTYDMAGRRTAADDPDAGQSSATYDRDGNVLTSTDAKSQTISTAYDDLGRPTQRTGPGAAVLANWTYWEATDTPSSNRGRPKATTSFDGANAWVSTASAYDNMGRPLTTSLTAPASAGTGLAGTYTTNTTYDTLGHPTTATFPAVANLPTEKLTYGYSPLGLPTTLNGVDNPGATPGAAHNYVSVTTYQGDGKLRDRTYGTGANPVRRVYSYEPDHGRLGTITTGFVGAPAGFQQDTYTYDADGNVSSILDESPAIAAGGQRQCFSYDLQSRLTAAWTTDTCAGVTTANSTIGPDPYKQQFTYDELDNLTSIKEGTSSSTTRTYGYSTASKPHAVSSVATTAGTGTTGYTYDANAATTTKTNGTATTTNTWDAQQHLVSVTDANGTTSNVYGADGTRLLRKAPDGAGGITTTLYLGAHEVTRTNAGATTARRMYSFGGATVAQRDAAGIHTTLADTQGSAQLSVDAGTTTVHRQRYLPYGASRGTPNQLPGDQDFLGKVKDDTTGLIQMGARYYDTDLAKFISADPLLAVGNPGSLNAYSYASGNPTSSSDPSGLFPNNHMTPGDCGSCGKGSGGGPTLTSIVQEAQQIFYKDNAPYALPKGRGHHRATKEWKAHKEYLAQCAYQGASCMAASALELGLSVSDAHYVLGQYCGGPLEGATGGGCASGEARSDPLSNFLTIDLPITLLTGGLGTFVLEGGLEAAGTDGLLSVLAESSGEAASEAVVGAATESGPLALNAGSEVSQWAGPTLSRVTQSEETMYRVWGGGSAQAGEWLTSIEPASSAAAYVSEVIVPAGTTIQVGTAGEAFGQAGGWSQVRLLNEIPLSSFGTGVPLAP